MTKGCNAAVTDPALPGWHAPTGRYGRRRGTTHRAPRWLIPTLVALTLVAGLAMSWRMYSTFSGDTIEAQVTAFRVIPPQQGLPESVEITFQVAAKGYPATSCLLRARSEDGREVGRAEAIVDTAGKQSVTVTRTLLTSRTAVTGEVYGCAPRNSSLFSSRITL